MPAPEQLSEREVRVLEAVVQTYIGTAEPAGSDRAHPRANDFRHAREFFGDKVVTTAHEEGTIQRYFNFSRVREPFQGCSPSSECTLIRYEEVFKRRPDRALPRGAPDVTGDRSR
jgi:hypothetical protein